MPVDVPVELAVAPPAEPEPPDPIPVLEPLAGAGRWVAVTGVRRTHSRAPRRAEPHRWVAAQTLSVVVPEETPETPGDEPTFEIVDEELPAPIPTRALPERSRAIRITRVETNGRRRWSVDFLVRQPEKSGEIS